MNVAAEHGPSKSHSAPAQRETYRVLLFHSFLFALTVVPIYGTQFPIFVDFPNHLARVFIAANIDSHTALQSNYVIESGFTPYMAMDVLLAPMAKIFGIYRVGQIFPALIMGLIYCGILALYRVVHGRLTVWPAVALPLLYNYSFAFGFLNYHLGVGLVLLAFAGWLMICEHSAVQRFVGLAVTCFFLYFTHMFALGIFGILVFFETMGRLLANRCKDPVLWLREATIIATPFLLALVVYFAWMTRELRAGETVTLYGNIVDKAIALLSPTLFYVHWFDFVLIGCLALAGTVLWLRGAIRLALRFALPLAALAVAAAAMPNRLFGVWGTDIRIPVVMAYLFIATTCWAAPATKRARLLGLIMVVTLVAARVATVAPQMVQAGRQFVELRQAMSVIPEGARVLYSHDNAPSNGVLPSQFYWHWGALAIIERDAYVPTLFTGVGQVKPAPRFQHLDARFGRSPSSGELAEGLDPDFLARKEEWENQKIRRKLYWANWNQNFDYLIRVFPPAQAFGFERFLQPVSRGSFFRIDRITRIKRQ